LGTVPDAIVREIATRPYDLRLLLRDDVPFVTDVLRYGGETRQLRFEHFVEELERHGLPYQVIEGGWAERNAQAMAALEAVMSEPHRFRPLGTAQA
jgi:nicotinamide riboside kinase